jgi:hypothetical protein
VTFFLVEGDTFIAMLALDQAEDVLDVVVSGRPLVEPGVDVGVEMQSHVFVWRQHHLCVVHLQVTDMPSLEGIVAWHIIQNRSY